MANNASLVIANRFAQITSINNRRAKAKRCGNLPLNQQRKTIPIGRSPRCARDDEQRKFRHCEPFCLKSLHQQSKSKGKTVWQSAPKPAAQNNTHWEIATLRSR